MSEREILFRGKRVDNGEWIEGGFIPSLNGKRFYVGNMFECVEIIPETRCEYTGLTDKNGTKIFERDIVKVSNMGSTYYARIEWDNSSFWVVNHDIQIPNYLGEISKTYLEVVGNIHDNPELLKGE